MLFLLRWLFGLHAAVIAKRSSHFKEDLPVRDGGGREALGAFFTPMALRPACSSHCKMIVTSKKISQSETVVGVRPWVLLLLRWLFGLHAAVIAK